MYSFNQRPNTHFSRNAEAQMAAMRNLEYVILVGRNNSGKSYLMRHLAQTWGQMASYLGPSRYANFNVLGFFNPVVNKNEERYRNFVQTYQTQPQNSDTSHNNLQQSISDLTDEQRNLLTQLVFDLLGAKIAVRKTVENNAMSQSYIECDGHNIVFTSSGFRLIVTILTTLLDTSFNTFLIDEPELGISPEAQGILSDFLSDRTQRQRYFPHIHTIVFATHSTVFLDRTDIGNNFTVSKSADTIDITKTTTQSEFSKIHFFLLGNRFETLYLPSAIVIVEGKTDLKFIERSLALRFPNSRISVIAAHADSQIKHVLAIANDMLSDVRRSPYADRIFVVLDRTISSASLPRELQERGVRAENIVRWPENGIEYYYPPELMRQALPGSGSFEMDGDMIRRNGDARSKNDLADWIVARMDTQTAHATEFESMLLQPIAAIIN